jgi:hypothetical protein
VDWIDLAQETNRSGRLVDRAMNFRSVRNFLINLVTVSSSQEGLFSVQLFTWLVK